MTRATTPSSTSAATAARASSSTPRTSATSRTTSSATAASSKALTKPTRTTRTARTPALRIVHKFEDGSEHAQTLEQHIFQLLKFYARMYASEDAVLSHQGREKLSDVAKIVARSESASVLGKMLKEKQIESFNVKHDDYNRFLDEQQDQSNTKLLAARLRNRFGINKIRASEDLVRQWKRAKKNLRAAAGT